MAKIMMTECKLRDTRFVPKKDAEAQEFTPASLAQRFFLSPKNNQLHQTVLRLLKPDGYIGLAKNTKTGQPTVFYWEDALALNDIARVLKADPTFSSRLLEVWRVESALWDSKFDESVGASATN